MKIFQPLSGDILLTRNLNGKNPTPGYWNHCALVCDAPRQIGVVCVEVQRRFREVVAFHYNEFYHRYPEMIALRPQKTIIISGARVAINAVGTPIQYSLSISRTAGKEIKIDNCLSFLRKSIEIGTGLVLKWRIPDDVLKSDFLKIVFQKKELIWTPPKNKWQGRFYLK